MLDRRRVFANVSRTPRLTVLPELIEMRTARLLGRAALVLPVCLGACTQRIETRPMSAMAPAMAVEQFLGAVNAQDFGRMSNLFGTKDGTIGRLLFEKSGNRLRFSTSPDDSLEQTLNEIVEILYNSFPYESKPEITIYRGSEAREFGWRILAAAKKLAESGGKVAVLID